MSKKQVDYSTRFIQTKYDLDSMDEAWLFYQTYYKCLKNKKLYETTGNLKRKYVILENGIKIGGDVIFNFKNPYYETLLVNKPEELKRLREYKSEEKHYSFCNLSVFPITGKLQNYKGKKGNDDRLDVFLLNLYNYYSCEDKASHPFMTYNLGEGKGKVSKANKDLLKNFLDSFSPDGNAEDKFIDYCKKIYWIDNNFALELKDNGKNEIDSPDRIVEYMNLAKKFWDIRKKYMKNPTRNSRYSNN